MAVGRQQQTNTGRRKSRADSQRLRLADGTSGKDQTLCLLARCRPLPLDDGRTSGPWAAFARILLLSLSSSLYLCLIRALFLVLKLDEVAEHSAECLCASVSKAWSCFLCCWK